ncbi:hypothetical protein [uncultured Jannaschia sp.]|uniref:hypothetical protein n=1 Tax=uncultured Jannaschia sp. TaxID=293347 RepID=UPI00262D1C3B|nr:hypothetical protein [uncultured Jannaschia sp.]
MPDRIRHVVALYEMDRTYGGPEEGGWWYDHGALCRVLKVVPSADAAYTLAARANRLMNRLQRDKRDIGSMAYTGGRYAACVFEHTAPRVFPEVPPHYE